MLEEEAKLIFRMLKDVKGKLILNVGSSDEEFYKEKQPYIWKYLMEPLANRNDLINFDKKKGQGIHLTGDVTKNIAKKYGTYDVIILSNILEHINVPFINVINNISEALNDDGILVISSPGVYPIHKDPIDNNMRFPNLKSWVSFFEFCEDKFKIIEYTQTKEEEAPVRYCFKQLVYSTVIKCVKNKKYIPVMSDRERFEISYVINKLKEEMTKNFNNQMYRKISKDVFKKIEVDGLLAVKMFIKDKVKNKNKELKTAYYNHLLSIIRQAGHLYNEEVKE